MPAGVRPGRDEFHALARDHTVVPLWCEVLADLETPVSAFAKLVGEKPGFLLESVEHGERWGRFSFLGRDPVMTLVSRGGAVECRGAAPPAGVPLDRGILAAVEALLARLRSPSIEGLPPFHGGVVGYLGYDVVREIERLPDPPTDDAHVPDALLFLTGSVAAFDHFRQRLTLVENVVVEPAPGGGPPPAPALDAAYDAAAARLAAVVDDLARPLALPVASLPDPATLARPDTHSTLPGEVYRDAVEAAREHIFAGDIFQVVLSQRFDLAGTYDPFAVYRVLRQVNPSPYMYVVRHPEVTLVGSSPEPMVQLLDGRVISRPIAGTRRRGRTDDDDRRLAAELAEHPKEQAEHVMLVDLARNDIGRVVRYGTARVDELMTLERYSHVMHLTSQVSGDLAPGRGAVDVLRATFPAGTVSGAPKVRAMEIIDELEPTRRGPYAGVVGYLDFSGNLDTAIAIRTMVWDGDGRASVQAGAGVVADSDPALEDLECSNKAQALLTAAAASTALSGGPEH
ncbi:MAG: anthranilate synthase component I [Acidimicrobiia bacterium]|nr:anthranilate synthase component I [Acidimicrobiia bacterium]